MITGFFTIRAVNLSRKTAIEVVDRQEFIKAAIEFKEAFFDEIKALQDREIIHKNGTNNFANTTIKFALDKHIRAFFRFKEFLSPDERLRFHICWNTYICKEESEQYQNTFEDYFAPKFFDCYKVKISLTDEKEHEMRDLALQRIHYLFEFAKH